MGSVPEVDDDQLAALRRLRAAFGPIEAIQVISDHPAAARGSRSRGKDGRPQTITPEEHGEARALLARAVSDPDWQAARQALDDLMRKLLAVHRLLEAEERLTPASRRVTAEGRGVLADLSQSIPRSGTDGDG
jgi:hypothetical protein